MSGRKSKGTPKSTPKADDGHQYEIGDIVLAKVKGYPNWPGRLVEPESVPANVLKERPLKGPKYCVRFYPTADFAWANSRDMSLLTKSEIETYVNDPHKKSGDLLKGYQIAGDPGKWEEELEQAEKSRKEWEAELQAAEEKDQLEEGEGDDDEGAKTGKKRKRQNVGGKAKESEPKKRKSEGGAPDSKKRKGNAKKEGKADKKAGSEEAGSETPQKPESSEDGLQKVKDWRHKLQRTFLGKGEPKAEDMPSSDQIFTDIEVFDMKAEWLKATKLAKVLKRIALMEEAKIPRNGEFSFKDRAQSLVNSYHTNLLKDEARDDANGDDEDGKEKMTNGADTTIDQDV